MAGNSDGLIDEVELYDFIPDNTYLLLTPGPLSTTKSVKAAMLFDLCTWDEDYKRLTQSIRERICRIATVSHQDYSVILMQGSGTFSVESVLTSAISRKEKLLVLSNGAYGQRMAEIAKRSRIPLEVLSCEETMTLNVNTFENFLQKDLQVSHVAFVHCETTTGILNPLKEIASIAKKHGKILIVDAMSSFGGIEMDIGEIGIDFLISSANKCIQGVPGFGYVVAKKEVLEQCKGISPSLSLDLYEQWMTMRESGKWRFTSPTHVVRAFHQALIEHESEGGTIARMKRYQGNQKTLSQGMKKLGFENLIPEALQSPIITSFYYPKSRDFSFDRFYLLLKENGFVIYPGKISHAETFRIANIGNVFLEDILRLLETIKEIIFW